MELEHFRQQIGPYLSTNAGVYKFIGDENKILYVGKAKNIKNRVSSYFNNLNQTSSRLKLLVKKAVKIEYTVVETEHDALLLENSLIKKHQPKYNIQLKDSKTYPFIKITNERFPKIYLTRNRENDGSEYLGPYTSVNKVRTILEFIKNLYPVRTCNYNLSEANIKKGNFKICLEYHLGNCMGPCEGFQSEDEYNKNIEQVKDILKGKSNQVIQHIKEKINEYAENYEFEQAENYKKKLLILENFQAKSTIVNPTIHNVDVFSVVDAYENVFISYLKVINGTIIQTHAVHIKNRSEETIEEILEYTVFDLRQKFNSNSTEIILPISIDYPEENTTITVPQRGDKKKLMDLAYKNALQYKDQILTRLDKHKAKTSQERVMLQLKNDFNLANLPEHIECFDNSNIQGSFPVASLVVFKEAKPSKKDYRHFNIKTVEGPNDFASMEEVVFRRYKRLIEENQPLPQLILIDGGKGQLSSAMASIDKLGIKNKVTVAAIAKKLEEIYFPGDPIPLHINKRSEGLRLLQQIRNEAHRFAITFHRNKRSKSINTGLLNIKGVGSKTAEKLLKEFKSIKKIKTASTQELEEVVGKHAANLVKIHFEENS